MSRVGTQGESGLPTHLGVPVTYVYGGSPFHPIIAKVTQSVESNTENVVVVRSSRTLGTMLE